ncbi:ecdysteroid-phosphate phosphatase isoform X2 [Culicoides brevitarsis]|uniref:ecdysteroid-phosphate phosphatase isoform X2 n=1 Tax=Culicoides brevitarsis TaxID=469753 RepID=UPI00307B5C98
MAALPPRRLNTPSRPSNKHHQTELQILLQMGVPKARAEKALASTGHRGVQLASDWLLAHVNDPFLDDDNPREYILYVCPTGTLLEELEKFWIESRTTCGWNGAHNFTPHITLVSFFKAPDECALQLSKTLKQVVENMGAAPPRSIALERYISPNFMGYFVPDEDAEYLKHIALQFVKEVSHSTISLESHVKSLHLTLAYQFPTSNYNGLVNLVEALETTSSSNWELRLYSRDARLATRQVYKVLYPHRSEHPDELELRIGDYIYINPDSLSSSADGWVEGISWLTGVSGFLPKNYVERAAECEAWTIHTVVPLGQFDDEEVGEIVDDVDGGSVDLISQAETASVRDPESVSEKVVDKTMPLDVFSNPKNVMQLIEKNSSILSLNSSSSHETPATSSDTRKIYIMRHGERVDFTFGDYIPHCFDAAGNYTQKDLNMPEKFHPKKNGFTSWSKDSPLTNVGIFQAKLVGSGLRKSAVQLDTVYCSPAFRCVQTCDALLDGLGIKSSCKIRIEPCLFEWLAWYQDGVPDFYDPQELQNLDFNVDTSYEPLITLTDLKGKLAENIEEFYDRNAQLSEIVAKNNSLGNVLFVGHAITLDTCTRKLLNREIRASSEIARLMHKISYCSLIAVESSKTEFQMWELTEPPFSQMTHTNNQRFDWHAIDS